VERLFLVNDGLSCQMRISDRQSIVSIIRGHDESSAHSLCHNNSISAKLSGVKSDSL
jgi:hypothetical protein